jgi:uncharacterized protein YjiS (DUF1127 family)
MLLRHEQHFRAHMESPHAPDPITASAGFLSPADHYIARGRRLRSEAIHRFAIGVAGGLLALAKRLVDLQRHWREVRHTERALRSLSPRMLRDIGIEGQDISAIARGVDSRRLVESRKRAQVQSLHTGTLPVEDCRLDEAA